MKKFAWFGVLSCLGCGVSSEAAPVGGKADRVAQCARYLGPTVVVATANAMTAGLTRLSDTRIQVTGYVEYFKQLDDQGYPCGELRPIAVGSVIELEPPETSQSGPSGLTYWPVDLALDRACTPLDRNDPDAEFVLTDHLLCMIDDCNSAGPTEVVLETTQPATKAVLADTLAACRVTRRLPAGTRVEVDSERKKISGQLPGAYLSYQRIISVDLPK